MGVGGDGVDNKPLCCGFVSTPPPPWWILGFHFRAAPPLAFKEPPAGVLWSRVLITPTSQLPLGAFRGPSLLASFLCCWPRWCSGDEHQTCLQTIPGLKIVPGAGSDMDGVHHPQHTALSQSPSALLESLQHCFFLRGHLKPLGGLCIWAQIISLYFILCSWIQQVSAGLTCQQMTETAHYSHPWPFCSFSSLTSVVLPCHGTLTIFTVFWRGFLFLSLFFCHSSTKG